MLAAALVCLVVGISDGDTLTARCPTGDVAHPYSQDKVRLAEIDAPESSQPYGRRAKEYLSALCYQVEQRSGRPLRPHRGQGGVPGTRCQP